MVVLVTALHQLGADVVCVSQSHFVDVSAGLFSLRSFPASREHR